MKKITALLLLTMAATNVFANPSLNTTCFSAALAAAQDNLPVEHNCSHVISLTEKLEDSVFRAQFNCNYAATIKTQIDSSTNTCTVVDIQLNRIKF